MKNTQGYYNPFERFEWVEYIEDGADEDAVPFRAKIRSNLTQGEVEGLVWGETDEDGKPVKVKEVVWPLFAPFVVDWNLQILDERDTLVKLEPPSVAGPEQFKYLPNALIWEIIRDIKLRSTGRIDPKRLSRRSPAAAPTSSSDATSPAET